ncbi:MerR family transcriptional regulator [Streptomyces sp. NPDC001068]|uniref:MerR family transcriptional regulator n=1 Tax=Streptomyces sp. NPDC001068 TaxID=3364544 RepID=UPI0036D00933
MTEDAAVEGTVDEELLTIGAFAARSRLSAKALRRYDRLGLLAPAYVDGATGYRYYQAGQVERARLVALLRRLDMPLARVAEVVEAAVGGADTGGTATGDATAGDKAAGDAAAGLLAAYWSEVERRVAGQRTLAAYLRARLSGRSSEMHETFAVQTVEVPAQVVITETRHTLADELPAWIGASLGRLEAAARECGGVAGAPFVVYYAEVSMESDGPAEACVPVADEAAARAWVERHGRGRETKVRVEPARTLAYTRIGKAQVAHPQILAAFEAVEGWVARQGAPGNGFENSPENGTEHGSKGGLEYDGPCREVYFADWDAAGPEDPVCDVAFPVRQVARAQAEPPRQGRRAGREGS